MEAAYENRPMRMYLRSLSTHVTILLNALAVVCTLHVLVHVLVDVLIFMQADELNLVLVKA